MKYHYTKPNTFIPVYGEVVRDCSHPVYNECTLFMIGGRGLAVIQQSYHKETKSTFWGAIDPWLQNELYLHPNFKSYFDTRADEEKDGLFPTVTVRQIMWALRIKPLPKERWETVFDRKDI